jgi:beta-glucosidase
VTLSHDSIKLREAVSAAKSLVVATATVTNTGKVAATEVVQCYVGNRGASLEQPVRSLQGFARVVLQPEESKLVSFTLGFGELSFFNNSGKSVIEPTQFTVWIGGDSLAADKSSFRITGRSRSRGNQLRLPHNSYVRLELVVQLPEIGKL